MTSINRTQGSGNQNFKQIEGDSWTSIYLPAICAGIVMTVVLFLAVSCSKKSDQSATKISAPSAPSMSNPAPSTAASVTAPAPKKAAKKHRPANVTYVDGAYGVSFSYPRKYSLQAGDKKSAPAVQTSLLKPGAVQIAAVDMPDGSYPDTDFSSGLLNVSVTPGMNAEECAQFVPNSQEPEAAQPNSVKLGANEFTELEQMNGEGERQSDLKYFHLFKNGACYQFALDVETSRKAGEELAQTDRGKVFQQLEKILTSARIKDVEIPGVMNAQKPAEVPATAVESKADDKTEKAQVVTPAEQK
jgi:hypothetical protein